MRKVSFAPDAEVAKKTVKKHYYNYLLHFPLLFLCVFWEDVNYA